MQTASHIFVLTLAMLRAFALRIQNCQEGTIALTPRWLLLPTLPQKSRIYDMWIPKRNGL
jgi:hypothetical protein